MPSRKKRKHAPKKHALVRKRKSKSQKAHIKKAAHLVHHARVVHNLLTGKFRVSHGHAPKRSKTKAMDDRVPTGVPGLDKLMQGGYRHGTINLIGGGAGSGKSILCMQFLVDGIENHGENGVYISFEEDADKILNDLRHFGWGLEEKIAKKKLAILYYTPQQVEKVVEGGGGIVRDTIESVSAKRLVVDSLTAFTLLHESELARRRAMLGLFDNARKWGVTALMTSQQEQDPQTHLSNVLEFETDAVVLLYNMRSGKSRKRSIEVFKMRGSYHASMLVSLTINSKGMRVSGR